MNLTIHNSFMYDHIMPLDKYQEGYELFDSMKVQKGMPTFSRFVWNLPAC
jgi:hypothetical protein